MASGYTNDAYPLPPAPNTLHRKRRCIVVLACNNPSAVPAAIIDSVGNCLAQLLVHEITEARARKGKQGDVLFASYAVICYNKKNLEA